MFLKKKNCKEQQTEALSQGCVTFFEIQVEIPWQMLFSYGESKFESPCTTT